MRTAEQIVRLSGQGAVLAVFLSVNKKVHVVAVGWVKACLQPIEGRWPV